ncbi:MAG: ISL3 family transposase [Actinobacteria bacterium]|nr:ISL3 family transposase [Actinomycetota bacterium]MBU1865971.1 ISL3 family transposase [Actinomycetota bacterium]
MSVIQGSRGATVMVGMPGFVVGAQELVDGELWLYVETTAEVVGCWGCGTRAVGQGRARTAVRDLAVSGRPTVLMWSKRRWRCPDSDCATRTWSETTEAIAPRAVLTERARRRLAEMVNVDGDSIAGAAAAFGVGWHTANQAVADHTDPHIEDPARLEGVEAIGVDEKRFLNATPDRRTVYTTQIVDLDRHRLLDVIEGRSRDVLGAWLESRGDEWCDRIRLATLDPAAGYRRALEDHLRGATLVVDHFHAIRLANQAIDDIRRRVQQHTLGHRGRKTDPLYRARRVLLTGDERLSEDRFQWMRSLLALGDPEGEVSAAWVGKELLRDVYAATDEAHARRRMIAFYTYCADAEIPELARLARTVSRWAEEVFAYHRTARASNARVENTHMLAEKTRRNAHGFTNIANYRRRLLGRLGIKWHTQTTARIRGRQPRFIA